MEMREPKGRSESVMAQPIKPQGIQDDQVLFVNVTIRGHEIKQVIQDEWA